MKQVAFALSVPQRSIALVTLIALLAWTMGFPAWLHKAEASDASNFSDLLSDSDLSVNANHTIVFTLSNGIQAAETLRVTFDPDTQAFDFTGLTAIDVALSGTGGVTQVANVGACAGGTEL